MKWRYPGDTNSCGMKKLSRRVSIIAAIDTDGNVYQSLSQHNSTGLSIKVFLSQLVEVLDSENENWR